MRALVVIVCGGCNIAFGLDQTHPADAYDPLLDKDRDGIANAVDNCPNDANVDQLDSDRDGLGDACDGCDACEACAVGPNHDEDGDKIPDGCDPCPQLMSSGNSDGDMLDDACDPGPPTRITFFDGFATLDENWQEVGARWAAEQDRVHPAPQTASNPYQLQWAMQNLTGTSWYFEVGIEMPSAPTSKIGIATAQRNCTLRVTGPSQFILETGGASKTVNEPLPEKAALRLRIVLSQWRCELAGTAHFVEDTSQGIPSMVRLFTENPVFQFRYAAVAN